MASKRTFLAFLGLFTIVCTQAVPSSRILGGTDASSGQYPWVTSIRVDGAHACVGSIINEEFIVTAAHCVSSLGATSIESSRVTARVGSVNQFAGGQIVKIRSIVIYPSYGNFLHDIALLKLDQSLVFNDKINKISLTTDDEIEEGTSVFVTGWGLQETGSSPYKLQYATMSVLSGPECELQAGYGYDSVICLNHTENAGICRGDDGAGVVTGNKLVGVASFSFGSCGTKYPDVSSKISYYRSWINNVIA
ncbi:trypsin beta [Lucilia sericata]|uniref:trypsin beta n=1 Tax=Lucilia sericata TaxID=13632 RepID=UPI0018A855A2|nr:trypsin beta [Lucilia sericata]